MRQAYRKHKIRFPVWNATMTALFFCINQDIYDSLTPEQQEVVDERGKLAVQSMRARDQPCRRRRDPFQMAVQEWRRGHPAYEDLDIDSFKAAVVEPVTEWYIGELKTGL